MPRKRKSTEQPIEEKSDQTGCTITLKCVGRIFRSEGKDFEDAIHKIKISGGARALSVITVTQNGSTKERILNARQTGGLFGQGSPTMKAIHLQKVKQMLGV